MYKQIFIPNAQNNNITIPRKWYGQEVEVIVFPTREKSLQRTRKTPVQEASLQTKEENIQEISKIFEKYLFPFKDFKFDRNEANNYD
ncbi:MAG: hypothetical protein LBO74_00800 [Candidatus Symbiothrix sp.]|jgi:hypothetical protein|nr:hypothetical protein [Candidatus Symbiothrix sp.]